MQDCNLNRQSLDTIVQQLMNDQSMYKCLSGRGFLGLPQKGVSIKTELLCSRRSPVPLHHRGAVRKFFLSQWIDNCIPIESQGLSGN
jgi:hypothetical protein